MNYFVEGLQGSGKSTLVKKLSERHPDYKALREGDYSPVELAWCAYVNKDEYPAVLDRYNDIRKEIEEKSHEEDGHMVICYTQIITDIPGFHKDLERYEIYNNRLKSEAFRRTVMNRFSKWESDENIFECSLFQNIVEDMILFQNASDQEIMDFYYEIHNVLRGRDYHILYLKTDDIASNINVIRKERSDNNGKELWFPLMLGYFNESPFAVEKGITGEEALLEHLMHRQELELSICRDVFPERHTVLKSKKYLDAEILSV